MKILNDTGSYGTSNVYYTGIVVAVFKFSICRDIKQVSMCPEGYYLL